MRSWLFILAACGGPAASSSPTTVSNQPSSPPMAMATPAKQDTMPTCGEADGTKCIVGQMEYFARQMCKCTDKSCADSVNETMTKWGTEMAKSYAGKKDERPDPDMAKKSADIMQRYVECMTKNMMGDTKPPPNPCGDDPCGG
jgi:hypothetical protein